MVTAVNVDRVIMVACVKTHPAHGYHAGIMRRASSKISQFVDLNVTVPYLTLGLSTVMTESFVKMVSPLETLRQKPLDFASSSLKFTSAAFI